MGLRIKSRRAEDLARELASLTGEPIADAVTIALQERVERCRAPRAAAAERRRDALRTFRERISKLPMREAGMDDQLLDYDETGLFR
jgi:antitoxin VapB